MKIPNNIKNADKIKLSGSTSLRIKNPNIVDHNGTLKFTKLKKIGPSFFIRYIKMIVAIPVDNNPRFKIANIDL